MALQEILPIWLPILLLLCAVYLYKKSVACKGQKDHLPPGPPKLPIIGNLHQMGQVPHQSWWKLSKEYGPVMYLRLGGVPMVIVSSPEAAKQVLKVHDLDSCNRPASTAAGRLSYNYRNIAFSPFGDHWREIRKICVLELLSSRRVLSFKSVREEEVASMIDSISQSCSSPETIVDLGEKLMSLMANITCTAAFGRSFCNNKFGNNKFDNDKLKEVMHEASVMLGTFCVADFFPIVGSIVDRLTGFSARLKKNSSDWDDIFEKAIDAHLDGERSEQGQEDIIDVLLKIEREQAGAHFTRSDIKGILIDILFAGVDTSSVTVTWTMSELMKEPRAMKKAQEEVRSLIGNKGKVSEADMEHLDYLKLVVKETMRLHPPAPLLVPRETISVFNINGYHIPPRTRLYVNAWAIGRDPCSWDDPEKFVPERFEGSTIDFKGQQNFEFLPFGGGRRGCPGMQMGLAMVDLALANLLYHFDWKLPNGMEEGDLSMEEIAGLTLMRKHPLNLVPVKYHAPS